MCCKSLYRADKGDVTHFRDFLCGDFAIGRLSAIPVRILALTTGKMPTDSILHPGNLSGLPGHSGVDIYRVTWVWCFAATSSRYGWPTSSKRNQSESFGLLNTSVMREAISGYSCALANTFCM